MNKDNSGKVVTKKQGFVQYLDPRLPLDFLSDTQPDFLIEIGVQLIGAERGMQRLRIRVKRTPLGMNVEDAFTIWLPLVSSPSWSLMNDSLGWGFQSSNVGSIRPFMEEAWYFAKEHNPYVFAS